MQKETKEFMLLWVNYLRNPRKYFEEYHKKAIQHIGWLYSYKGKNLRYISSSKEVAFHHSYDRFKEIFGDFNVDENEITFEPLFEGITLDEYLDILRERKAEIEQAAMESEIRE